MFFRSHRAVIKDRSITSLFLWRVSIYCRSHHPFVLLHRPLLCVRSIGHESKEKERGEEGLANVQLSVGKNGTGYGFCVVSLTYC